MKNKEFIIKIRKYPKNDPEVDIEVTVEWTNGKVFGQSCRYDRKDNAIESCKNTMALLEQYGMEAIGKDGDLDQRFLHDHCYDKKILSEIDFIIDEQI